MSDLTYSSLEDSIRSPDDKYPSSYESSSSDCISVQESDCNDTVILPSLRQKLQGWAVKFRSNLTVETIENLLEILRDEQLSGLPKSAATLLETKTNRNVTIMESLKNTNGYYVYFSIEECLKWVITEEYTEDVIRLLFNIDGLPLYNNSSQQFWPILALILHNEYESQPFIVAVQR